MSPQGLSAFLGPVCKQNVWRSPASFAPNCPPPSDTSSAKPHAKISPLTHQTRRESSWHGLPLSSDNPSALFSPSLVWSTMLSTFQEFPQWSFTSSVTAGRQQPLNARSQHKCKTPEGGGRAPPHILSVCGSSPSGTPRSNLLWLGSGAGSMSGWHVMEHVHTLAS